MPSLLAELPHRLIPQTVAIYGPRPAAKTMLDVGNEWRVAHGLEPIPAAPITDEVDSLAQYLKAM